MVVIVFALGKHSVCMVRADTFFFSGFKKTHRLEAIVTIESKPL